MSDLVLPENAVICYSYSPYTNEFIGETYAMLDKESSIEENLIYQYPAYSTDIAPPKVGEKEKAIFEPKELGSLEGSWKIVEDHRGEVWYFKENRQPWTINFLGAITSEDLVKELPPLPEPEFVMPTLSKFQLLVLLKTQLHKTKEDIDALIESIPDETKKFLVKTYWETEVVFSWDSQSMQLLLSNFGVPLEQLKQAWITGSEIKI